MMVIYTFVSIHRPVQIDNYKAYKYQQKLDTFWKTTKKEHNSLNTDEIYDVVPIKHIHEKTIYSSIQNKFTKNYFLK